MFDITLDPQNVKCIKDFVFAANASVSHLVASASNKNIFKMKMIVVALALVAVAAAAPTVPDSEAKVVRSEYVQSPEGGYSYGFETDTGINKQETGEKKEALDEENKPHTVVVVRGTYSYIDPEGNPVSITYYADETGFHAEGDTIPKEPVTRR